MDYTLATMNTTNIHAILTQDEQCAIVTALDFWYRYNLGTIERDDFEQARLALREFGPENVSDLGLKIATLK